MTIQARTANQSKTVLQACLNDKPESVKFHDPGIFVSSKGDWFTGANIPPGDSFLVVMDHPRRSRFAEVTRKTDGTFKVK